MTGAVLFIATVGLIEIIIYSWCHALNRREFEEAHRLRAASLDGDEFAGPGSEVSDDVLLPGACCNGRSCDCGGRGTTR